jgi:hypothetical protein
LIIAYSSDYNGKGFVGRDRKLVEAKLVALHSDLFCFSKTNADSTPSSLILSEILPRIKVLLSCAERDVEMDKQKKRKRKYNCCCIGWILIYAFNEIKGLFYYVRLFFNWCMVSVGLGELKTVFPATKACAPASIRRRALASVTPPSISIRVDAF